MVAAAQRVHEKQQTRGLAISLFNAGPHPLYVVSTAAESRSTKHLTGTEKNPVRKEAHDESDEVVEIARLALRPLRQEILARSRGVLALTSDLS